MSERRSLTPRPDARWALVLRLVLVCPWLAGCAFLSGYAEGRSTRMLALEDQPRGGLSLGLARFAFDDLGSLSTDTLRTTAIPWKVAAAALVLDRAGQDGAEVNPKTLRDTLARFGFIVPASIENWSGEQPLPAFDRPLGIVSGYVTRRVPPVRLEVANLGCAACHAGVLYDRNGLPQNRVWLGLPNTSLNLEAYSTTLYRSLKRALRNKPALVDVILRLFPETPPAELRTIEAYVLPQVEQRFAELDRTIDAPTPFPNGGPGLTNGIGSLKRQLGLLPPGRYAPEIGFVSIPDIGNVTLRTSLLADGVYGTPGVNQFEPLAARDASGEHLRRLAAVMAFFTVPSMGMKPEAATPAIPRVEEILRFIQSYRPPPFPGPIDPALGGRGREIYHANCARCHGTYSEGLTDVRLVEFPNRLSSQEEMNTDPERWKAITPELIRAITASPFGTHIVPQATRGYVAPRLSGLWATAPYLHNGSVPTLWHLMNPRERPKRFHVGGHRLDYEKVGIAGVLDAVGTWRYPQGYEPWSAPDLYDTTKTGLSNRGHEREFESLSEADKLSLLEYLKLL